MKFYKPTALGRTGNPFSRYKSLNKTIDFKLQQLKRLPTDDDNSAPPVYRIVMKVFNNQQYQVWHGDEVEGIMEQEWKYIESELYKVLPPNLAPNTPERSKWLLNHFTTLAHDAAEHDSAAMAGDDELSDGSGGDAAPVSDAEQLLLPPADKRLPTPKYPRKNVTSRSIKRNPNTDLSLLKHDATISHFVGGENTLYNEPSTGARVLKLVGAWMAANAFYLLLEKLDDGGRWLLMLLLNLFIAYVILVREGKITSGKGLKVGLAKTLPNPVKPSRGSVASTTHPNTTPSKSGAAPVTMSSPSNDKQIAGSTMQRVGLTEAAPHSWSETDSTTFQVRIGPDYNKNKLKAPSAPALFELISVDVFACKHKVPHITDYVSAPTPSIGHGSTRGVPHIMIVNMMAPWYEPSMFAGDLDGEGHSMVFYGQMTESTFRQLSGQDAMTPAVELLRRFCNDETEKDRLKMIPSLVNADEAESLPSMVKKMVSSYNAKPILMSKPCHVYSKTDTVYEMDIDAHNWAYLATKAYASMHDCLKDLIVDVGFVLQGNDDDELPEAIFLAARLNYVTPDKVIELPL